jgi:hypothetical protein
MKSKLVTIGKVSLIAGLMTFASSAFASSAFAQAKAEGRDPTIIILYASSANAAGSTTLAKAAPVGAADDRRSDGPVARPVNYQSAAGSQQIPSDPPSNWMEPTFRRDTSQCLGAHLYGASVVNSVPSSCFLGNSGPTLPGGVP